MQTKTCELCRTAWESDRLEEYGPLNICPACKAVFRIAKNTAVDLIGQYSLRRIPEDRITEAFREYIKREEKHT